MTRYRLQTPPIVGPGKVTDELTRLLQNARRMTTSLVVVGQPYKRVPMRAIVLDVPDDFAPIAGRVLEIILGPSGRFELQQSIAEREEWKHVALLTPSTGAQPLDEAVFDDWASACLHMHWAATRKGSWCVGVLAYCPEDTTRVAGLTGRGWKVTTGRKVVVQFRKGAAQVTSLITKSTVGHGPYIGRVVAAAAPPVANSLIAPTGARMESIFAGDAPPMPLSRRAVGTALAAPGAEGFRLGVSAAGTAVNLALNALTLAVDAPADARRDLVLALLARALGSSMSVAAVVPPTVVAGNALSGVELRLRKLDPRDISPSSAIPWAQIEPALLGEAFRASGLAVDTLPTPLPAQFGELLTAIPGGDAWCSAPLLMLTANPGDDLRGVVKAVGATMLVDTGTPDSTMLGNLLFALLASSPSLQRRMLIIRPPQLVVPPQLASQAIQIVLGNAPEALGTLTRTPGGWSLTHASGAPATELDADLHREPTSLDESAHQVLIETLGVDGGFGSWADQPAASGTASVAPNDDWLGNIDIGDDVFATPSRPTAAVPRPAVAPAAPADSGPSAFAPAASISGAFLDDDDSLDAIFAMPLEPQPARSATPGVAFLAEDDAIFPAAPAPATLTSATPATPERDAWTIPAASGADDAFGGFAGDFAVSATPGALDDFGSVFTQPLDTSALHAPQTAPAAAFFPADEEAPVFAAAPIASQQPALPESEFDLLGDPLTWASMNLSGEAAVDTFTVPAAPQTAQEAAYNTLGWFDPSASSFGYMESSAMPDGLSLAPLPDMLPSNDLTLELFPAVEQPDALADGLSLAPVSDLNFSDDLTMPALPELEQIGALTPLPGDDLVPSRSIEAPLDLFAVPVEPAEPEAQDQDDLTTAEGVPVSSGAGSIWAFLDTIQVAEVVQPASPAETVLEEPSVGVEEAAETADASAMSDATRPDGIRRFRGNRHRFRRQMNRSYRVARPDDSHMEIADEEAAPGDLNPQRADTPAEPLPVNADVLAMTAQPVNPADTLLDAAVALPELGVPVVMPDLDLSGEVQVVDLSPSVVAAAPAPQEPPVPLGTLADAELLATVPSDLPMIEALLVDVAPVDATVVSLDQYLAVAPNTVEQGAEVATLDVPQPPTVAEVMSPGNANISPDGLIIDGDAVWAQWQAGRSLPALVREVSERNPAADPAVVRKAIRSIVESRSARSTPPAAVPTNPVVAPAAQALPTPAATAKSSPLDLRALLELSRQLNAAVSPALAAAPASTKPEAAHRAEPIALAAAPMTGGAAPVVAATLPQANDLLLFATDVAPVVAATPLQAAPRPASSPATLALPEGDSDDAIWARWQAEQTIDVMVKALSGFSEGIKAAQTRNHIYAVAARRLVDELQADELAERLVERRAPLKHQREQYDTLLRRFARKEKLPIGQPRQQLEGRLVDALRAARAAAAVA